MRSQSNRFNRVFLWVGVILMLVIHQDLWFWDDDETLIFGFLPIGLAYHVVYSLVIAAFWAVVVAKAWPRGVDFERSDRPEEREVRP